MKAPKSTMGPQGLVPSLLVFCQVPTFMSPRGSSQQKERFNLIAAAPDIADRTGCDSRINTARPGKLPLISPGDQTRIYREQLQMREGPFKVVRLGTKSFCVTDGNNVNAFPCSSAIPMPTQAQDPDLQPTLQTLGPPDPSRFT